MFYFHRWTPRFMVGRSGVRLRCDPWACLPSDPFPTLEAATAAGREASRRDPDRFAHYSAGSRQLPYAPDMNAVVIRTGLDPVPLVNGPFDRRHPLEQLVDRMARTKRGLLVVSNEGGGRLGGEQCSA